MQSSPAGECVFCRIVAGRVPAAKVAEGQGWIAFRDLRPQAPTHVLVVPTAHVPDLDAWEGGGPGAPDLLAACAEVARRVGLAQSGYRTIVNTGRDGGQEVLHLHAHVLGGRPLGRMLP